MDESNNPYHNPDFFDGSEKEKQKLLNDLRLVGPTKPVGFHPMKILTEVCGVTPQEMQKELEARSLTVYWFTQGDNGAFYAYDRDALGRLLESGKSILERNGWPTNSDEFVRHLTVLAEDPDLYRLIMKAFADPRLKDE